MGVHLYQILKKPWGIRRNEVKQFMKLTKKGYIISLLVGLVIIAMIIPASAGDTTKNKTLAGQDANLKEIIYPEVAGPGLPDKNWTPNENSISSSQINAADGKIIEDVPALIWSYGCSPTSASMLFGYYDRHGYPKMYEGPENNGFFPLTNNAWGPTTIEPTFNWECPLSASHQGQDGRTTKGHVDDYYFSSNSINRSLL